VNNDMKEDLSNIIEFRPVSSFTENACLQVYLEGRFVAVLEVSESGSVDCVWCSLMHHHSYLFQSLDDAKAYILKLAHRYLTKRLKAYLDTEPGVSG